MFGLFLALVVLSTAAISIPNLERISVDVAPSDGRAIVAIPASAVEVSDGVFDLGFALDNGQRVQGFAFVDYRKNFGKPGTVCGNDICEQSENANNCAQDCGGGDPTSDSDTSSCYAFIAKDAKWKVVEPYLINPANSHGMNESAVAINFAADIQKWEDAAGQEIIGAGTVTSDTLVADTSSPDSLNEVYFGEIDGTGTIGVTIVWGIFSGPPFNRRLVEWDQIYDEVDFNWSLTSEPTAMNWDNIAIHELGHSVGMADIYEDTCSEMTMYGFGANGETKKTTLEDGDINGVQKLY